MRFPHTFRFVFVLAPVVVLAGACSSSNNNSGGFNGEYCQLIAPCCAKAGLRSDGETCRAFLGAVAGSANYDFSKGDACLAEMRAAKGRADFCELDNSVTPSCEGAFQLGGTSGTKKPGDPCETDAECAASPQGKVACASTFGAGGTKTSVCQLQIAGKEGDTPCAGTIDGNVTYFHGDGSGTVPPSQVFLCNVKDGVYCYTSLSSSGPPAACARIAAVGAACEPSGSTQFTCVKGAYCDSTSKTCKAKPAIGEKCSGSASCATGAYCDTSAGSSATCVAQLADGADCTSSSQCLSDSCNGKKCVKSTGGNIGLAFLCGST